MGCSQKLTLQAKYHRQVELSECFGVKGTDGPYTGRGMAASIRFDLAERTLASCQTAQRSRERHIVEHGCWPTL
jgi:hypothetical protein